MKRIALCVFLSLLSVLVYAQEQSVSGTVKGDGETLIGVSVMVKGTTTGTVTDYDGNFTINVPDIQDAVLQFSYIGYRTQQVFLKGRRMLQVVMTADTENLDEVVVVAYGSQKKADLTSSIAVIKAEDIASIPVANLSQAMQGRAAGVTVTQSGIPGADASIRIRGANTINSTEPLYVVDGIPGAPAPNSNDVESIQILKDAATCALYGARGSNGVIVITTKKGSKGVPRINYSGYYGWQWAANMPEMLSAEEYVRFVKENYEINKLGGDMANGYNLIPLRVQNALQNPLQMNHTDWLHELYRTAPMTRHSLSISSGGEYTTNYISATYLNQEGIQQKSKYESLNFQINTNVKRGIFHFGETLNVYIKKSGNNASQTEPALRNTPLIPVYNADNEGGFDGATDKMDNINPMNPMAMLELNPAFSRNEGLAGSVFAEFTILKDFVYKADAAVKLNSFSSQDKTLSHVSGTSNAQYSSMTEQKIRDYSSAIENTLTYNKQFQGHRVNAMIGYTWEYGRTEGSVASANKFTVREPVSFGSKATDAVQSVSGTFGEWALQSFLARVMYDYEGRYLFTGNFRRDGSSKFGSDNRFANFPSFSAGWRISEEHFMQSARSFLDNLKLRISWGLIGSQFGIGNYEKDVSLQTNAVYVLNNQAVPSVTLDRIVNNGLRWEEQSTTDVGLDMDFFNGKLSFTGDYFYKKTTGMLISVPVPASGGLGFNSSMLLNAGDVKNWGVELSLTGRKKTGNFQWDATVNWTLERNEVLRLGTSNTPITGGETQRFGEGITRTQVGFPLGQFYGYRMEGIYQIGDSDIPAGLAPGDVRYADISGPDGVKDGKITSDDRTFIGNPFPSFTYNFGFNAYYKGFDFSVFFQGVQGADIFNENRYWTEGMKDFHQQGAQVKYRWTPTNPSRTMPRAVQGNANNLKISDRFVEDGSYLRLKTLSVGYTLPVEKTRKAYIERLRIYVMAQNLATLTAYSGFDPEVRNTAESWVKQVNMYNGIDRSVYPVAPSFFVGVELEF